MTDAPAGYTFRGVDASRWDDFEAVFEEVGRHGTRRHVMRLPLG